MELDATRFKKRNRSYQEDERAASERAIGSNGKREAAARRVRGGGALRMAGWY